MDKQKIARITKIINDVKDKVKFLECDGTTRVLNYLLDKNNIAHTVMVGSASKDDITIPLHYWIAIDDMTLDLKSKMWFGDDATEGLFKESNVSYHGNPISMNTPKIIYDILIS